MAGFRGLVLVAVLISAMALGCYGAEKPRPFSDLKKTLVVTSTVQEGQVLKAGADKITVSWALDSSVTSGTDTYKNVKVKLCYAPISQLDRPWRKTIPDNLKKDKTCQFTILTKAYTASNTTETYTIKRDIPGATYFIRAYVYDSSDKEVAYGQTTDAEKKTNLFTVIGISGRTTSIDVASGVFSAFSVLSLVYFFFVEKKKGSKAAQSG